MKEFFTQSLVLDKEDVGEYDSRVFLYGPEYGKIVAKLKSSKKILSKLNSHLEPFNLVSVRIIDRGPQIVDALLLDKFHPSWQLRKLLNFIKETTLEWQSDNYFWQLIKQSLATDKFDYGLFLAAQGFDPKFAICQNCQIKRPAYFLYKDQFFYCKNCIVLLNLPENLYINV